MTWNLSYLVIAAASCRGGHEFWAQHADSRFRWSESYKDGLCNSSSDVQSISI